VSIYVCNGYSFTYIGHASEKKATQIKAIPSYMVKNMDICLRVYPFEIRKCLGQVVFYADNHYRRRV